MHASIYALHDRVIAYYDVVKVKKTEVLSAIKECSTLAEGYEYDYMAIKFPYIDEEMRDNFACLVGFIRRTEDTQLAWALVDEYLDCIL